MAVVPWQDGFGESMHPCLSGVSANHKENRNIQENRRESAHSYGQNHKPCKLQICKWGNPFMRSNFKYLI